MAEPPIIDQEQMRQLYQCFLQQAYACEHITCPCTCESCRNQFKALLDRMKHLSLHIEEPIERSDEEHNFFMDQVEEQDRGIVLPFLRKLIAALEKFIADGTFGDPVDAALMSKFNGWLLIILRKLEHRWQPAGAALPSTSN